MVNEIRYFEKINIIDMVLLRWLVKIKKGDKIVNIF